VQCRKKGASNYGNKSESVVAESNSLSSAAVRRLQHMLNTKHGANLDVDGVLGDLSRKSINRYMPAASAGAAPNPDRTTGVQGKTAKNKSAR
jgi:hypothetical protein